MVNLTPRRKKILIFLGLVLLFLIVLDFNFLWANLQFMFMGRQTTYQIAPGSSPAEGLPKITPNTLIVKSLNITAPIIYVTENSETVFQAALMNGVVHFPGTANPGQKGNCYIFGHSSDYVWSKGHYKSVFAVLPQIEKGADIIVSDQEGNQFVYTVTNTLVVAPNDTEVLDQQGNTKKLLTLQTSYPVGTALKRFVVQAELK